MHPFSRRIYRVLVEGLGKIDVESLGSQIRYHDEFKPKGSNVNFIEVTDGNNIKIRTYERGVEGETLACGAGSVAAAIISSLKAVPRLCSGHEGRRSSHFDLPTRRRLRSSRWRSPTIRPHPGLRNRPTGCRVITKLQSRFRNKNAPPIRRCIFIGRPRRARTDDPRIKSPLL